MSTAFRNYLILAFLALLTVLVYISVYDKFKITSSYSVILKKLTEQGETEPRNPVNVFIDLGANKGDSIYNFVGLSTTAQGGNLNSNIFPGWFRKAEWIIYAIEANPFFDSKLAEMKQKVEEMHHKVHLHKKTAAWIKDGTIDFYLDTVNPQVDFWGSSLNKNHVRV